MSHPRPLPFLLSSTSFNGQDKEVGKLTPKSIVEQRLSGPPLSEHSQTLPLTAVFNSPGNTHPHSQKVLDPSLRAGKGKVVLPDPTLLNTKHTFSFHQPTDTGPTTCTNVITLLAKPLYLFKSSSWCRPGVLLKTKMKYILPQT